MSKSVAEYALAIREGAEPGKKTEPLDHDVTS